MEKNLSTATCNIMQWNVWSIMNEEKLSNVLQVFEDNNIQIGCLTETWFDAAKGKFSSTIKEAGYNIKHSHREDKRGGGTAIIYRDNMKIKPGKASSSTYKSFEFTYVYWRNKSIKTLLLCLYRKQEIPCKEFCSEFEIFFDDLSGTAEEVMIMGDFNVWDDVEGDRDAKRLRKLMNAYGLTQINQEPTHREGHTLDHLYINDAQTTLLDHTVYDGTLGVSTDHYPCVIKLPCSKPEEVEEIITMRQLGKIDAEKFKQDIQNLATEMTGSQEGFEESYNKYRTAAEAILNEHAPEITRKV